MNTKHANTCGPLTLPAISLGLFLLACGSDRSLAQTIDGYTAERPFTIDAYNSPSGNISTIAAVEPAGAGALYQASYYKSYTDEAGRTISWGGALQAVLMDESGRFREDNGVKGKLEGTTVDYIVDIFADTSVSPAQTRFRRFQQTGSGPGASLSAVGSAADMDTLGTVWNARDMLAGISQDDLMMQRPLAASGTYAENAGGKRFIFTWLDAPGQTATGAVNTGEVLAFTPEVFAPDVNDNWRYLGLADRGDAMNLVRYVRGRDIPGWRSRLINLPGDEADLERSWILGDIVNSAPLVVSSPKERYDIVYGDATYKKFKDQYAHRRQMIYVGANDGMLHAFNGGVWNTATRSFQTAALSGTRVEHSLGAEMWAYVPMNLLPHLQWLKEPDYSHVYFVDGSPQAFDVNIFADDVTHPGGWGTILVTGMRFGGGPFGLDLDTDGNAETVRSSAIIVMDITDPEKPPVLLAELSSPELGFTTGTPAVIKTRRPDATGNYASPGVNRWALILGSGPDDLDTATSKVQKPALLAWDLVAGKYIQLPAQLRTTASDPPGFYGSFTSVDRNNDYADDVLYAGTIEGTEQAPAGRLKRIVLDPAAPAFGLANGTAHLSTLIDIGKPIVARPAFMHFHANREDWLLFGTGRSFTTNDYHSDAEQRLVGIKDAGEPDNTMELSSLVDSTDILVQADALSNLRHVWDGQPNSPLVIDDIELATFDDLSAFMNDKPGWYKKLRVEQAAERVVTDALFVRSSAIFTSFLPESESSENTGASFIYALNFRTGTADAAAFLGVDTDGVVLASASTGKAELSAPALNTVQGNEPQPDEAGTENSDDSEDPAEQDTDAISMVAGTSEGNQERVDFTLPPTTLKRISWENLETAF